MTGKSHTKIGNRQSAIRNRQSARAPERTCIACRRRAPQRALVRLMAWEGALHVSLGSGAGRGAYVCPASNCLAAAARGKLGRAFPSDIRVPPAAQLAAMVREAAERKVMALLGQGRRMGCVAAGQEAVADRLGRRAAALLLVTVDAPEGAEALAAAASAARIPVARALTREGLGTALGASPRWAAAIGDPRLAAGILEYLAFVERTLGAAPGAGPSRREQGVRAGGMQGGRD